jgi:hypothetical protein
MEELLTEERDEADVLRVDQLPRVHVQRIGWT